MPDKTTGNITTKDRIDILLVYYESLRWDVMIHMAGIYTLVAALTVVLSLIPAAVSSPRVLVIPLAALVLMVFTHFFWRINRDITKAAARLRKLEDTINDLAGGEELLDWENRYGGMATGWMGRGEPLSGVKPPR